MDEIEEKDATEKDIVVEMMEDEQNGEAFSREYLKRRSLSSVRRLLYDARHRAELTQQQLAERTGKVQSVIARWELDCEGRISFAHFTELLFACGFVPRLTIISLEEAKNERIYEGRNSMGEEVAHGET